ncbi:MAG: prepilin peptidase [Lachnospiraceae bacterium]|nr:prepilin peptidase [Lachnospiraceae bacterium]
MDIIEDLILLLFLFICSYEDLRTRHINFFVCIVTELIYIFILIFLNRFNFLYIILGLIPGALIYLSSILFNGQIGKGDGIIIAVIGTMAGILKVTRILLIAFILVLVICTPILIILRKSLKTRLPFVPFILLSFIIIKFV